MSARHFSGSGDPNGAVFAYPGDIYQDETGKFWFKQSGANTNTNWVVVAIGGGGGNPPPGFYGLADLGDVVVNAGGDVLSSTIGLLSNAMLFFRDLTISNATRLVMDPAFNGPTMIFVDGTLTVDAGCKISADGSNASTWHGGLGGSNSRGATGGSTLDGGNGGINDQDGNNGQQGFNHWAHNKAAGDGGNAGAHVGGTGGQVGTATPFAASHLTSRPLGGTLLQASAMLGGIGGGNIVGDAGCGGGGGASGDPAGFGGGGGGGGGGLFIFARNAVINGQLTARGGNGANGSGVGDNAGGGGGMGGVVALFTQTTGLVAAAIIDVTAGAPGAGIGAGGNGTVSYQGEAIIVTPLGTSWTS